MANPNPLSGTLTTEFGHELEAERESWLRRRFLWYNGVLFGLLTLSLAASVFGLIVLGVVRTDGDEPPGGMGTQILASVGTLVSLVLHGAAFVFVYRHGGRRDEILRMVFWLVVLTGTLSLLMGAFSFQRLTDSYQATPRAQAALADEGRRDVGMGISVKEPPKAGAEGSNADHADPATQKAVAPAGSEKSRIKKGDAPSDSAGPAALRGVDRDATLLIPQRLRGALVSASGLAQILITHVFACVFLPWTVRESVRPIIPLLGLNAIITVCFMSSAYGLGLGVIALSPLVAAPGAAICWWRNSRFHQQFTFTLLRGRYAEIKRELTDARKIHESLFPTHDARGVIQFSYLYQPMRSIGGDFVYARFDDQPSGDPAHFGFSLLLIDVTGHGIPAALTVNRLFGEVERLFAENPRIEPGEVLRGLNRYVYLTLAQHDQYPTAVAIRFDPERGELRAASAGHPPAFIRTVDHRILDVESTCVPLGVLEPGIFDPAPCTLAFGPGDTFITYTDGASEARAADGRQLTTEGLRRAMAAAGAAPTGEWPRLLITAVDRHRHGPPADDTLIVEVARTLLPAPSLDSQPRLGPKTSQSW